MSLEKVKELLKAHDLANVTDFISDEYIEDYKEETDYLNTEITEICDKYDGWGISAIEEYIIYELKKQVSKT